MQILLILTGVLGGIIGGMGMGGGTLLIPALEIFFGIEQSAAQAINLISFIPMSVVALTIHFKSKLVELKGVWQTILSGLLFCVLGVFLAKIIGGELLKKAFGGFLIILSLVQFIIIFKKKK